MKFLLLTSSLVLSLVLGGTEVLAMEENDKSSTTTPVQAALTQEDWLTQSTLNVDLVKQIMNGVKKTATEEDKRRAQEASEILKQNALARKASTEPTPASSPETLTTEDKEAVSWFAWMWGNNNTAPAAPEPKEEETAPAPAVQNETPPTEEPAPVAPASSGWFGWLWGGSSDATPSVETTATPATAGPAVPGEDTASTTKAANTPTTETVLAPVEGQ